MISVMVVDDAAFMRMMIKTMLIEYGYQIAGEASNGQAAIDLYSILHPDLVMMDITMPDMDGIQAVREIKRKDPAAKIIMCSAMGQHDMVLKAIQAGAKDFIVKPFQTDRVVEAICRVMEIKMR